MNAVCFAERKIQDQPMETKGVFDRSNVHRAFTFGWIEGGAIDVDLERELGEMIKDIPTLDVA
jgi:hypothetical protein